MVLVRELFFERAGRKQGMGGGSHVSGTGSICDVRVLTGDDVVHCRPCFSSEPSVGNCCDRRVVVTSAFNST
jgi:hypothetical protein